MSLGKKLALVVLALLFLLSIVRLTRKPPAPKGVIQLSLSQTEGLASSEFEARQQMRVAISAVGSVAENDEGEELAVYGWILSKSTRNPVWIMGPASIDRLEGQMAFVDADTINLEEGRYSAFLTSHWDGVSRYRRSNSRDRSRWHLTIQSADDNAELETHVVSSSQDQDKLWSAAPLSDDQRQAFVFEVHRPTDVGIYAIGELEREDNSTLIDYSWIEDVHSGRPVWHLSLDNTQWAGGATRNRMYRGTIPLTRGVYRAVARTDGRHAYEQWRGNPPYDPSAWGITLTPEEKDAVTGFDPWMDANRRPIISFTRVQDDASLSSRFTVAEPASVVVWAYGEITSGGSLWDFATLSKVENGNVNEIWSMDHASSLPAGGAGKNRMAVEFFQLSPGEYELSYESDGSHAYGVFNDDPPHHPERWGVTMFPVSENATEAITVLD